MNSDLQAELSCAESLLNCYCREVGFPNKQVQFKIQEDGSYALLLTLPFSGCWIVANIQRPSLLGSFQLLSMCQLRKKEGEIAETLGWKPLSELLFAEMKAKVGSDAHPELGALIENNVEALSDFLKHPQRKVDSFIASEQSMVFGHAFHPSPKSRIGFSREDLRLYSPECSNSFQLEYFEVRRELIVQDSVLEHSTTDLIASWVPGLNARDGFAIVPAHPWQARYLLNYALVQDAILNKDIVYLGKAGPEFHPTSSVRTLYSPKLPFFVKTSLNVRITNCIRRNAVHEMQSSLEMTKAMRAIGRDLKSRFPGFVALEEPAWLSVRLKVRNGDDRGQADRISESFGLVLRENLDKFSPANSISVVAASLFGNRGRGKEAIADLLGGVNRVKWFERYCELVLDPILHLFFEHGLMFEPHLQNIVVGLSRGMPERIFLRDFDNGKLIKGWFDEKSFQAMPDQVRNELGYSVEEAWDRFVYCLIVNHLAEAIHMLAGHEGLTEQTLWRALRDSIVRFKASFGNARSSKMLENLMERPHLPAKGNFLTRFLKKPDRKASFYPVPNPMSEAT